LGLLEGRLLLLLACLPSLHPSLLASTYDRGVVGLKEGTAPVLNGLGGLGVVEVLREGGREGGRDGELDSERKGVREKGREGGREGKVSLTQRARGLPPSMLVDSSFSFIYICI